MKTIKGYKGFNKDMTCRGFQFETGKEYEHKGKVQACESGFHFCENPLDVFGYYAPGESVFCEVEGSGKIDKHEDDTKVACSKLKIETEIGLGALIGAGIKFILEKVDFKNAGESATGYQAGAQATGDRAGAQATGDRAGAQATGYQAGAQATGYQAGAQATGYQAGAQATGDRAGAQATGYQAGAQATGYQAGAQATGDRAGAQATGDRAGAQATGICAVASAIGDNSAAEIKGDERVKQGCAIALGINGKAKGEKGCWLTLAEWEEKSRAWERIDVQTARIDGKKIKADTWYKLEKGKFVEA